MAKLNFDSRSVEPQAPRDDTPLPAGTYTAEITGSEVKALKSGNGQGLNLEFTVIDPEQHARRKVWQTLNIQHSNSQAEQIGQAQLSALCRALGIDVLEDSDNLFQRIVRIKTTIRPPQGDYKARAEVQGYEPAGAGSAPVKAAAPAAQPAAKAPAPWAKKAA